MLRHCQNESLVHVVTPKSGVPGNGKRQRRRVCGQIDLKPAMGPPINTFHNLQVSRLHHYYNTSAGLTSFGGVMCPCHFSQTSCTHYRVHLGPRQPQAAWAFTRSGAFRITQVQSPAALATCAPAIHRKARWLSSTPLAHRSHPQSRISSMVSDPGKVLLDATPSKGRAKPDVRS